MPPSKPTLPNMPDTQLLSRAHKLLDLTSRLVQIAYYTVQGTNAFLTTLFAMLSILAGLRMLIVTLLLSFISALYAAFKNGQIQGIIRDTQQMMMPCNIETTVKNTSSGPPHTLPQRLGHMVVDKAVEAAARSVVIIPILLAIGGALAYTFGHSMWGIAIAATGAALLLICALIVWWVNSMLGAIVDRMLGVEIGEDTPLVHGTHTSAVKVGEGVGDVVDAGGKIVGDGMKNVAFGVGGEPKVAYVV